MSKGVAIAGLGCAPVQADGFVDPISPLQQPSRPPQGAVVAGLSMSLQPCNRLIDPIEALQQTDRLSQCDRR
jgi:hypothetical protein